MIEVYIDPQKNEECIPKNKEFLEKLRLKIQKERISPNASRAGSPNRLPKTFDLTTLGYTAMVTWDDKKVNGSDNILRQTVAPTNFTYPHKFQNKSLSIPSGRKEV